MASSWKGSSKKRRRAKPDARAQGVIKDAQGRVHLLLQQSSSGKIVTGLSEPLFEEAWQDTLTLTTANAVVRHLQPAPSPAQVEALAEEAMGALSKLAEGLAAQSAAKVACAAGCAHCCHQSVGVTGVEAVAIVRYLRVSLTETELAKLRPRVRAMREHTSGMSYRQRYSPKLPCVFLGTGGKCTIYQVRPLVCRAVNSLSAAECYANLHDDAKRETFLRDGQGAFALLGPIRASHAMSAGLQLAGSEVYGLDMRPLDLVSAMDELLNNPGTEASWLEGRSVFAKAAGSNATANEQLRSLAGLAKAGA